MIASVILLNWNGWQDTIECLESVLRLRHSDFRVIVCDNGSTDDSLAKIRDWANGDLLASCSNPELSHLVVPPVLKPIPFLELTRQQAESSGACDQAGLVLIQNGVNLGFGGGCNVGLRYALRDKACQFLWLLNNDTVVEPDSLSALVDLVQRRPDLGPCGSLIRCYRDPKLIQARGGYGYCPWTGRARRSQRRTVESIDAIDAPAISFVSGASMLVSRTFVESIGLIEESYFLYYEELDWAMRAKKRFSLGYSPQSIIYHKEGATIGSNSNRRQRSPLSDKYLSHSKVLFTKRFIPWALPTVLLTVCLAAAQRMCRGDVKRAYGMLAFMLRGLVTRQKARTGVAAA